MTATWITLVTGACWLHLHVELQFGLKCGSWTSRSWWVFSKSLKIVLCKTWFDSNRNILTSRIASTLHDTAVFYSNLHHHSPSLHSFCVEVRKLRVAYPGLRCRFQTLPDTSRHCNGSCHCECCEWEPWQWIWVRSPSFDRAQMGSDMLAQKHWQDVSSYFMLFHITVLHWKYIVSFGLPISKNHAGLLEWLSIRSFIHIWWAFAEHFWTANLEITANICQPTLQMQLQGKKLGSVFYIFARCNSSVSKPHPRQTHSEWPVNNWS